MYCKNCGSQLMNQSNICLSCGFDPLTERNFCQYCGTASKAKQLVCLNCKQSLESEELKARESLVQEQAFRDRLDIELQHLSSYYQRQFIRIYESGETYKGAWNWSAFFFSGFWVLTKGCWLSALYCFLVILILVGILPIFAFWVGFIFAFMYGKKGNWIYYNKFVKNRQIGA